MRNVEKAEGYLKSALEYGIVPADAAKRLTLVPVDLTDVDTLTGAIGNAGKVGSRLGLKFERNISRLINR